MKKQMKRTVYEAPVTERFQVELEANFCGSANLSNGDENNAGINDQDINTDFGSGDLDGDGFTDGAWE